MQATGARWRDPNRLAALAAFLALLGVWLNLSWSLLPYDFMDLSYLFSLEKDRYAWAEWVHPLYIPLLRVYRNFLHAGGYAGPMLLPVERLNVTVAGLGLVALFLVAESRCRRPWLAAAAVLIFASSNGFWTGCLRSTPYALATTAMLAFAAVALREGRGSVRRYALAGVLAGTASGFHLALMALVPVGLLFACRERRAARLRLGAALLGGWAATLALAYALFIGCHADALRSLHDTSLLDFTTRVEQVPGTSIWSNRHIASQFADLAATLSLQGTPLLRYLLLIPVALIWRWRDRKVRLDAKALLLALACFVSLSSFFLINNTRNGLVFCALAPVPLALSGALFDIAILRWAMILLAGFTLASAPGRFIGNRRLSSQDPLLVESRFLGGALGPGDLLLVPGCPFPEVNYLKPINILPVLPSSAQKENCDLPALKAADLPVLIAILSLKGHNVFYSEGDLGVQPGRDVSGSWKERQIFLPAQDPSTQARRLAEVRRRLRLGAQDAVFSPQGRAYYRLRSSDRLAGRRDRIPDWLASKVESAPKERLGFSLDYQRRLAYLEGFRPGFDLDSQSALLQSALDIEPLLDGIARTDQDAGRPKEAVKDLDWAIRRFPRSSRLYSDRGVAEELSGAPASAASDLKKAIALDPDNLSSYLTLSQVYLAQGRKGPARSTMRQALLRASRRSDLDPEFKELLIRSNLEAGNSRIAF